MRLLAIEIQGFRSFKSRTTFTFPDRAGLCHVRGENRVEPALGANGSGKSTFWDAPCWCLYGKTARRLTAGAVDSWGSSQTTLVQTELEIAGQSRVITRTRRPNTLEIDGRPADQKAVDDLLGLTYERFLHVVLMGQFNTLFPDLKPTDRLNLLSGVLELDLWTASAVRAGEAVRSLTQTATELERRAHGLSERLAALQETRDRALENYRLYEKDLGQQLKVRLAGLESARDRASEAQQVMSDATTALRRANDEQEERERDLGRIEKLRNKVREDLIRTQSKIEALEERLASAHQDCDAIERIEGNCPTCKQVVAASKAALVYDAAYETAMGVRRLIEAEIGLLGDREQGFKKAVQDLDRQVEKANTRERKAAHAIRVANQDRLAAVRVQVEKKALEKNLADQVEHLRAETNPYEQEAEKLDDDILSLDDKLEEVRVILYDVQTQADFAEYWPAGFKQLRLWLVDQALDELEIHVNSSLLELGLREWRMTFAVERENKSGGVSRGFEILVHSPDSPDGVPWEAWSGGETQRLRIAAAVGLAELIRSRMPSSPVIEVWDEPTAHLDTNGVRDLIEFFSSRANDRQVWIVDHRSLDDGHFDRVVSVVKDGEGSFIE